MRKTIIVAGLLFLISLSGFSAPKELDGSELHELWGSAKNVEAGHATIHDTFYNGIYFGYIEATVDTLFIQGIAFKDLKFGLDQACAIVGKYLDDHPETWGLPAPVIIMASINESFGVKKDTR
jgi:hypothetical protein